MEKQITLKVNGQDVTMNNFVQTILGDVTIAIVENLRIDEKEIKTVEIKIVR
jgi:hypothetical protein